METKRKAFVIYEEDFDPSIETLPLCISLVKAPVLTKRCEQWEVKSLLSFLPILRLFIQAPLRPPRSLGYHGTKTPVATWPELHKSDFYCVALLLISIYWRLYLIPSLWRAFSKSNLKRMGVCMCVFVCMWEKSYAKNSVVQGSFEPCACISVSLSLLPCVVTLKWSLSKNHPWYLSWVVNPGCNRT